MYSKAILPFLICAAILSGCLQSNDPASDPDPTPSGDPELVHTGVSLVLKPFQSIEESLYVKNGKPGEWTISLLQAPEGTVFRDLKITYRIVEGLDGPQPVRATAVHADGRILKKDWTVAALPKKNEPPAIRIKPHRDWISVGKTLRATVVITDPEGDSIRFLTPLPNGATYRDSTLEWTPLMSQKGLTKVRLHIDDGNGNAVAEDFPIEVLGLDPLPYAADLSVGRKWWIHGYSTVDTNGVKDSVALKRQIEITAHDPLTGLFDFRLRDTLESASTQYRDTLIHALSLDGIGFKGEAPRNEALPFAWAANAGIDEPQTFLISGKSHSGLKQINPNTCLTGTPAKNGCGGSEYGFAPVLGRVAMDGEWTYMTLGLIRTIKTRHSYRVTAVVNP